MKLASVLALIVALVSSVAFVQAADTQPASAAASAPASAPAVAPASQPASAPASQPIDPNKVVATVGDVKITAGDLEAQMPKRLPAEMAERVRKTVLDNAIKKALVMAYTKDMPFPKAEVDEWKAKKTAELAGQGGTLEDFMAQAKVTEDDIALMIKLQRVQDEALATEKVAEFLKSHPVACFDGTKVTASHVLIACDFYASKETKEAARKKLQGIVDDIKAGKIEFADAAKQFSSCPSSQKGGDLGAFEYGQMVSSFADAAFAAKVGDVTEIVESPFGFHVVKVTARTDGSGELSPEAEAMAKQLMMQQLQNDVYAKAVEKNPVKLMEQDK